MKHFDCVTLFCPEKKSDSAFAWRRYLLHGVSLLCSEDVEGTSSVMYVFNRDAVAFCGGARCMVPEITPGCAVYFGHDSFSSAAEVSTLPDGKAMKVKSVKRYPHGRHSYVKVILS